MLKVGDKVLYIGEDFKFLWIKTSTVYTIKKFELLDSLCLKEISKKHSYDIKYFILATKLTEALT